jgi:WD40 repeat protein
VCGRYGLGTPYVIAYGPDAQTLALGGLDVVVVFRRHAQEPIARLDVVGRVTALDFSPDGGRLAVGTQTEATVFDLATDKPVATSSPGPGGDNLRFSPDGTALAILSAVSARVASASDGHTLATLLSPSRLPAEAPAVASGAIAFSTDGRHVLLFGQGHVWTFDATTGATVAMENEPGPLGFAAAIGPGGLRASGDTSGHILVWGASATAPKMLPLWQTSAPLWSMAFSSDGALLAAGAGGEVGVWDVASGASRFQRSLGSGDPSVRFDPTSKFLLTNDGHQMFVLDTSTGMQVEQYSWGHTGLFIDGAPSPDGTLIASSGYDGVLVWNRQTQTIEQRLTVGGLSEQVAFGPTGNLLYSTSGSTLFEWDVASGALLRQATIYENNDVTFLEASRHGKYLVAGVSGQAYVVISADTLAKQFVIAAPNTAADWGAIAPDDTAFVGQAGDGTMTAWDLTTGRALHSLPVKGHGGSLRFVGSTLLAVADVEVDAVTWPDLTLAGPRIRSAAYFRPILPLGDDRHALLFADGVALWDGVSRGIAIEGVVDQDTALISIGVPAAVKVSFLWPRGDDLRVYCNAPTQAIQFTPNARIY